MEKVLVVWIENETSHYIPLSESLIQRKTLIFFSWIPWRLKEVRKTSEEMFEVSRDWFMRFKERSCLHTIKVQGEAAGSDVETSVSYPGDLAKVISGGGYTKQRIFNVDKTVLNQKKTVAKTPCSQYRGLRFDSWSGN